MPLYEYQCETCKRRMEAIQKFSDAPLVTCEECGGPLRKLPSSPAIKFKGSGFYITDYGKSGSSGSSSGGSGEGKTSSSSADSGSSSSSSSSSSSESSSSSSSGDSAKPSSSSTGTSGKTSGD